MNLARHGRNQNRFTTETQRHGGKESRSKFEGTEVAEDTEG